MIRTALVSLVTLTLLATPAAAGNVKFVPGGLLPAHKPFTIGTKPLPAHTPFRPTFRPEPAEPDRSAPGTRHHRPHRPHPSVFVAPIVVPPPVNVVNQTVYVVAAPRTCEIPGYWSYHWVPYAITQNVWVEGVWGPDGNWIDSHWEARPSLSAYPRPYWVPGQTYPC